MLGVSKQNISNLENGVTKLSQAQHIAIRYLLDYQALQEDGNSALPRIMSLLVDGLNLVGHDYNSLKNTAQDIASAASKMSGKRLKDFSELMLKATYTRVSDLSEIDESLKSTIESKELHDWTADIMNIRKKG